MWQLKLVLYIRVCVSFYMSISNILIIMVSSQTQTAEPNTTADYLKIKIKNFGPISQGTITLKPLTVLTGPVGCGKSYAATLIYSIISAEAGYYPETKQDIIALREKKIDEEWARINTEWETRNDVQSLNITKIVGEYFSNAFFQFIKRNFLTSNNDLIKKGCNYFELDIESKIIDCLFRYSKQEFNTTEKYRIPPFIQFQRNVNGTISVKTDATTFVYEPTLMAVLGDSRIRKAIRSGIADYYKKSITIERSIYFPAERSGLTISQRSILAQYYSIFGIDLGSQPNVMLPGTMRDFFVDVNNIPDQNTEFADIAKDFEMSVLNGTVMVKKNTLNTHEIYLQRNNVTLPMVHVASAVRDLAVFLLYLKHDAKRGDLVVLEEPESNLHPEGQTRLARLLVQMTNIGIYVIITTHSPYILKQLNQCIIAGTIQNKTKTKVLSDNESIALESISSYRFEPGDSGYEILPVDITKDGIPLTDFEKTIDIIYDELESIRDKL